MSTNKEEHKQTQAKIIKFLFDREEAASLEEIGKLIKQTQNETKYHIERLIEQRLLQTKTGSSGGVTWRAYELSKEGRKFVMEGESQDDSQ